MGTVDEPCLNGPAAAPPPRHSRRSAALMWLLVFLLIVTIIVLAVLLGLAHQQLRAQATDEDEEPTYEQSYAEWLKQHRSLSKEELLLPTDLHPIQYWIDIMPRLTPTSDRNLSFVGTVKIHIECSVPTHRIILHSNDLHDLHTNNVRVYSADSAVLFAVLEVSHNKTLSKLTIVLNGTMQAGKRYYVEFHNYSGRIQYAGMGFYLSGYKLETTNDALEKRYLAATQFEVAGARMAFPCFDEPRYKAKFTVSIRHHADFIALSNMGVVRTDKQCQECAANYVRTDFATSVIMSTYLVAWVICDFKYKEVHQDNVKIRAYSRASAINEVDHALQTTQKILRYFTAYYDSPFQLNKLDLIALPDFSHGAMENWGLITFRETTMLYKADRDSRYRKQNVAMIVGHELAHQWFGNLVTMQWWTDLWLNEGFAHFMGYVSAEAVDADEKMNDAYIHENVLPALRLDSLNNSHPVVTEVYDPVEILQLFDIITYRKGSSLIRMMVNFLGEDAFREGLRIYLRTHQYSNAVSADLWKALDQAVSQDNYARSKMHEHNLAEVMSSWIKQSGYPFVHLVRDYNSGEITITQQRSLLEDDLREANTQTWMVPFTYTTSGNRNWTKPQHLWIDKRTVKLQSNITSSQWIVGNINYSGFYRVSYDLRNWKLLIEQLHTDHTVFPSSQRAQILDDGFEMQRMGILDLVTALNATVYLENEEEMLPWVVVFDNFRYIDDLMQTNANYGLFQQYMQSLILKNYHSLGWSKSENEEKSKIFLRQHILTQACYYGIKDCLNKTRNAYHKWMQTGSQAHIPFTLRRAVLCTAIREGGYAEWDFAWNYYLLPTLSSSEKKTALQSLSCTRVPWLLSKILNSALNNSVVRNYDIPDVMATLHLNPAGRQQCWQFVRQHWDELLLKLGEIAGKIPEIIVNFHTEMELKELEEFMRSNNLGMAKRKFSESHERVKNNIAWRRKNLKDVTVWLRRQLQ